MIYFISNISQLDLQKVQIQPSSMKRNSEVRGAVTYHNFSTLYAIKIEGYFLEQSGGCGGIGGKSPQLNTVHAFCARHVLISWYSNTEQKSFLKHKHVFLKPL